MVRINSSLWVLFFVFVSLASCNTAFALKKVISLECQNSTVKECLKLLEKEGQVTISAPGSILSKPVTVSLKSTYLFEGLTKILDLANAENCTIVYDNIGNKIVVSFVGTGNTDEKENGLQDVTLNPSGHEAGGVSKEGGGERSGPGPKEMQAIARQQVDLDAEFALPGGQKATLRQMKASQEKADMYQPPQDAKVLPQDGSPTFRQLHDYVVSGEKANQQDRDITMPDGKVVNSKVLRANSQNTVNTANTAISKEAAKQ